MIFYMLKMFACFVTLFVFVVCDYIKLFSHKLMLVFRYLFDIKYYNDVESYCNRRINNYTCFDVFGKIRCYEDKIK